MYTHMPSFLESLPTQVCTEHWVEFPMLFGEFSLLLLFSLKVVSDPVSPGLQHARPPHPSPNSWSLLKLMSTESVMPSNHLILCRPLLLLPTIFPIVRVFSNESALRIRWAKYWSFSISPSNEYSGLISFRMDWLDLLAAQGTLKGLLQQHSSKASILRHSAFFIVQLSHPYVTTGKTIALTMQTFVCKVMSLVFHTLSRFAVAFLPKSKCLFVSGGTGEKQTNSGEIFPSGTAKMCSLTGSRQRGWFLDTFALESDWQGSELRQETLGYHSQQWFAGSEE